MRRRGFLRAGAGVVGTTALSGCLTGLFETRSARVPPLVENRPDAVYYPTHVEGMEMVGRAEKKRYAIALTYSFPHRFWIVTGKNRKKVEIQSDDSLHLMAIVWDRETGVVPPNANLRIEITQDGEAVTSKSMWPMLSQNMGYHFGDNVALPGEGTYTVKATVGPMSTRRTGAFQGAFGEPASASFSLEFSQENIQNVAFERLEQKQGQRGAVDPMEMEMVPLAQLPKKQKLPGRIVGEGTSGDGAFVVTALDSPPQGVDTSGTYLAVSARTPYHRYPLPFMSLSATLARASETVFEGSCVPTLDSDLGYHYGAVVDGVESGDALTVSVGAPPQVARHEGYETAFFDMTDVNVTVQ